MRVPSGQRDKPLHIGYFYRKRLFRRTVFDPRVPRRAGLHAKGIPPPIAEASQNKPVRLRKPAVFSPKGRSDPATGSARPDRLIFGQTRNPLANACAGGDTGRTRIGSRLLSLCAIQLSHAEAPLFCNTVSLLRRHFK